MRSYGIVAVIAFGLGVLATFLATDRTLARRETGRAPGPPRASLATEQRLRESEAQNEQLRARIETLEQAQAAAESAGGTDAAPTDAPAREEVEHGPRYVFAGVETGLKAADWHEAGKAMAKLMPLLSEAGDVAHGRREMRAALWGDITRWFGPILTEAINLGQAGVPWSSPSVLANLVYATLREAGQPLDTKQQEALGAIGRRSVEEDTRRRASYGETTPRMRQMVEEARMEEAFFAEVDPILNDAQRAVLYPPGVRGITGLDVFGTSSVWDKHLARVTYADRAGLRAAATEAHAKALGLRAELLPHLESAVAEWERSLPDAFLLFEADAAAKNDVTMERADRVLFAADRQLALYDALLARAPLLDEEKKRILAREEVLVPLLVK